MDPLPVGPTASNCDRQPCAHYDASIQLIFHACEALSSCSLGIRVHPRVDRSAGATAGACV